MERFDYNIDSISKRFDNLVRAAAGVVICGRNAAKGEAKAAEIAAATGSKVVYVPADLERVEDARAVVRLVDMSGREVLRALDAELPGGRYRLRIALDDIASGAYLCVVEAGSFVGAVPVVVRQ